MGEGGFHTEDAAVEALREEYLEPDTISPDDARWIGAEVSRVFAAKREEEEAGWPPVTDFDRLSRAFDELEASGILALHCPGNTRSEGVTEAYELHRQRQDAGELSRGFVFYHAQDVDKAVEDAGIYLAFGSFTEEAGVPLTVARETVATVERNGLRPQWNGDAHTRILVPLNWQKRSPVDARSRRRVGEEFEGRGERGAPHGPGGALDAR